MVLRSARSRNALVSSSGINKIYSWVHAQINVPKAYQEMKIRQIEFAFFQPGFLAAILLPGTRNVFKREVEMFYGLTQLGTIHTAISLIAVAAGLIALVRDKEISPRNMLGKVYVIATILTCLTGFGIFQHGGFGKPHVLGIVTLIVLGVAYAAGYTKLYGRASPYIETVSYSMTFFFHMIPGVTETTTRLPLGAPLLPNADAPALQAAAGVFFVVFLIGATLQVRRLRAGLRRAS